MVSTTGLCSVGLNDKRMVRKSKPVKYDDRGPAGPGFWVLRVAGDSGLGFPFDCCSCGCKAVEGTHYWYPDYADRSVEKWYLKDHRATGQHSGWVQCEEARLKGFVLWIPRLRARGSLLRV